MNAVSFPMILFIHEVSCSCSCDVLKRRALIGNETGGQRGDKPTVDTGEKNLLHL